MPFAIDLIRQNHSQQLDTLASYACLDAKTFSSCINPPNKIMILDRLSRAGDRNANDAGTRGAFQVGTDWKPEALRLVHDKVVEERAGVCTTFAKAGAHILATGGHLDRHKLEIVAYKNHVFLVIGRTEGAVTAEGKGMFKTINLPHFSEWGFGWVIVDIWAGAMGYDQVVYHQSTNYPFTSMLDPLTLVMSREVEPVKPTRPVPVI